jgi:hypothetical protein
MLKYIYISLYNIELIIILQVLLISHFMDNKKRIIAFSIGSMVLFASLWLYSQKSKRFTRPNPEFGAYISGYTSGNISSESFIRIRFTNPVSSIKNLTKKLMKNCFAFLLA